jgi:hypothetical protein
MSSRLNGCPISGWSTAYVPIGCVSLSLLTLFQPPPSEPDVILSHHPALQ